MPHRRWKGQTRRATKQYSTSQRGKEYCCERRRGQSSVARRRKAERSGLLRTSRRFEKLDLFHTILLFHLGSHRGCSFKVKSILQAGLIAGGRDRQDGRQSSIPRHKEVKSTAARDGVGKALLLDAAKQNGVDSSERVGGSRNLISSRQFCCSIWDREYKKHPAWRYYFFCIEPSRMAF